MSFLSKIGFGRKPTPPQPQIEDLITKTLPLEIFQNIFSYLNGLDVQSATLVSKFWRAATIDTSKRKEFVLIKKFVQSICENLDKKFYSSQIEKLSNLIGEGSILEGVNLKEIKCSIWHLRKQILNVLQDLDEKDLASLEQIMTGKNRPILFEKIFELGRSAISKALTQSGNIDKAIEVANTISYEVTKAFALSDIDKAQNL